MKTARECALAGIDKPHWRRDAQRLGFPGPAIAAGLGDLTTDVAHEIEARDREWQAHVQDAQIHGHGMGQASGSKEIETLKRRIRVLEREVSAQHEAGDGNLRPLFNSEWSRMEVGLGCPEVSPRETFEVCIRMAFAAGLKAQRAS